MVFLFFWLNATTVVLEVLGYWDFDPQDKFVGFFNSAWIASLSRSDFLKVV